MISDVLRIAEEKMRTSIEVLKRELASIRTGRASPALVEHIRVDYAGVPTPLNQLARVSVPEARLLVIQPWDKSYIEGIVRALEQTGVGANPIVDKDTIRISLPPLSEEYRKNLVHLISEKQEEARKTIRHWREEAWSEIQEKTKNGEIREDDKFRAKDKLQELIDEYSEKIEKSGEKKKKEVLG